MPFLWPLLEFCYFLTRGSEGSTNQAYILKANLPQNLMEWPCYLYNQFICEYASAALYYQEELLWKNNQYTYMKFWSRNNLDKLDWLISQDLYFLHFYLLGSSYNMYCKICRYENYCFTVTSKQTLYALNHYVLLSVLPKVFTQKNHSCRVRMDSFLHRRRSGDNGIKNGFLFDIQTRIKTEA